ncbi:MAG: aryl-sulfate sulfotransferase [bacterium]|nr:aryl-sulfate sulfotransferase [bacterium]
MQKIRKKTLALAGIILMIAAIAMVYYFVSRQNKDTFIEEVELNMIQPEENVFYTSISDSITEKIQQLKQNTEYTFETPLWIHNPFGTNESSYYLAFNTESDCYLEYTISVEEKGISDFTRVSYIKDGEKVTKDHEYNIVGFVLGMKNNITLKLFDKEGNLLKEQTVTVNVPKSKNDVEIQLAVEKEETNAELTDGLYTVFPLGTSEESGSRDILSYDNDGVLRSKIAVWNKYASRILQLDDKMFYAITKNRFVMLSHLGQVEKVYKLGDYSYHHDYVYNEELNEVWILASDTTKTNNFIEDIIIALNLDTGKIREVLDYEPLMSDIAYAAEAKGGTDEDEAATSIDWLHLNALTIVDNTSVVVSSRELSAVIKVSNLDTEPTLDYIIADPVLFEGTEALPYVMTKEGEFDYQYGQHNVVYEKDDTLKEGCYYVTMYNNNAGWSYTRPSIDWSLMEGTGSAPMAEEGDDQLYSYYYKYLVDETNNTYQLVDSFEVPYSGPVSNAQSYKDNFVVSSGRINVFGEYTEAGELIRQYEVKNAYFIYRAFKYDFNHLWFQSL